MRDGLNMDTLKTNEEVSCEQVEKKSVKLEAAEERIDEMLLPLFPELDDSGIDSDSTDLLASSARRFEERHANLSDASSSDEDPFSRPWWQGVNNNNNNNFNKAKGDDIFKAMENGRMNPLDIQWPNNQLHQDLRFTFDDLRPERASPPLYEVELTASEEDDDGSVLELVIPMQPSRYKRVPTASPKKAKPKPKPKVNRTSYYSFICCMRQ